MCKITNYVTEVPIEELEQEIDTLAVSKLEQDAVLNKFYRDEVKGVYTESETDQLKANIIEEMRALDIKINALERKVERLKRGESEEKNKLKEIKEFFKRGVNNVDEKLYRNLLYKIVVYPDHIIEFYFVFSDKPEIFRYETKGKMEKYTIDIYPMGY